MKIYEMDDCTWFAAASAEEAIQGYRELVGEDADEYLEESGGPYELADEGLDRLIYHDFVDGSETTRTFREQLNKMIADGEKFPCMFATTEF